MIPFPDISPEIFSINIGTFEFALRWYAVSYILGFIAALFLMKFFLKRDRLWKHRTPPMSIDLADSFLTYLILGVIIGGRSGYVLFYNFYYYLDNPIGILRVWDGGMSFHGGFLGVCVAVVAYCRYHGIPLLSGSDLIALSTPPGLFFGRIANFINAELWGRPTEKPWGVVFPGVRAQDCGDISGLCARHPSQIYEAILEGPVLFLIIIVLIYIGARRKPGLIMGFFILGYGLSRFYVEFFRVPDPQFISEENLNGYVVFLNNFGITMGQLLSTPMILCGMILISLTLRKRVW